MATIKVETEWPKGFGTVRTTQFQNKIIAGYQKHLKKDKAFNDFMKANKKIPKLAELFFFPKIGHLVEDTPDNRRLFKQGKTLKITSDTSDGEIIAPEAKITFTCPIEIKKSAKHVGHLILDITGMKISFQVRVLAGQMIHHSDELKPLVRDLGFSSVLQFANYYHEGGKYIYVSWA